MTQYGFVRVAWNSKVEGPVRAERQLEDIMNKWATNGWKVISSNTIYVHHADVSCHSLHWGKEYIKNGGFEENMHTFITFAKD